MNKRIQSISLMNSMRPILQSGTISGKRGREIVTSYQQGNERPLRELIYSPDISPKMNGVIETLKTYLDQ